VAKKYFEGTGRRKTSTARVRIFEGDSTSTVNDMPFQDYFAKVKNAEDVVKKPLRVVNLDSKYYFSAKVDGGGITGQMESIRLGIARALYEMDPELKTALRKEGLVTRDPRMVERKKYHHIKARKKPQFSKR
jgi:small subunit ribosomal protein S9